MKRALLAGAALLACPAFAAVENYTIDPRHTYPQYEIRHMGISVQRGRFDKTEGKVSIDPEARRGSLQVTIDVASIDTADRKLDEHLRSESFFDAARNPKIAFKSQSFEFEGDQLKRVQGELTMAGTSRPVTLEAGFFACGMHPIFKRKMCGGDFTARIKRSDWGITYGIPAVADDVLLRINVEALKDE
jgi:polyisoprenoid-binding protein YceI